MIFDILSLRSWTVLLNSCIVITASPFPAVSIPYNVRRGNWGTSGAGVLMSDYSSRMPIRCYTPYRKTPLEDYGWR